MSPDDGQLPQWNAWRANAFAISGRFEEARGAALESLSSNANNFTNHRAYAYQVLAASNAHLGRIDEARAALAEALKLRPALTPSLAALPFSSATAEQRDRYLAGLRLGGVELLGDRLHHVHLVHLQLLRRGCECARAAPLATTPARVRAERARQNMGPSPGKPQDGGLFLDPAQRAG